MARDDAGDYSSARPHSSRPRGAPDSARGSGSARRASSPWSRDSPSPPRARSSRAYDEDRRRYGDSRYDSPPPRDAYYDRYSDRDRHGDSRSSRYDYDDDDYYRDRRRRRSPSPRYRRSPSPPPRRRSSLRRSPTPPPSSRSGRDGASSSRSHDHRTNGHADRSPDSRDRRDLPPPDHRTSNGSSRPPASSRDADPSKSTFSKTTGRISIALPGAAGSSSASARPLEAIPRATASSSSLSTPAPAASLAKSASASASGASAATADKLPPFFYKPLKCKDFRVTYDPALDTNPIKKGKAIEYRYDGEGLAEDAGKQDPRGSRKNAGQMLAKVKRRMHRERLGVTTYNWDKNSRGPPPPLPPCAILVTGFPSSTSGDAIHAHFRTFGRIEQLEVKVDPKTGGNLGLCWIKYRDDVPRDLEPDKPTREKYEAKRRAGQVQDGAAVAKTAVAKGNGAKVGMAMLRAETGVKVVLDADGKLCKAAVDAELLRLHPPPPSNPKSETSTSAADQSRSASSTPRAHSTSQKAPPPPDDAPPPPPSLPPPPPPSSSRTSRPDGPSARPPSSRRDSPPAARSDRWSREPSGSRTSALTRSDAGLPARPSYAVPPWSSGPDASTSSGSAALQSDRSSSTVGTSAGLYVSARSRGASPPELRLARPSMPVPPLPSSHPHRRQDRWRDMPAPAPLAQPKLGRRPGPAPGGRGSPGKDNMASAIAQAVEQAKKRLETRHRQQDGRAAESGRPGSSRQDDLGDVDMEMSSEDEAAKSASEGSSEGESGDEPDARNRLHYDYASGKAQTRRILPRGMAPVGAIAWQVSKKILLEKLRTNGFPHLFIEKVSFQQDRPERNGSKAVPNNEELQRHFGKYGIDRAFADADGWYITFDSKNAARRAKDTLDGQRFAGGPLRLEFRETAADLPPAESPAAPAAAKPAARHGRAPEPGSKLEALVKKLAQPPQAPRAKKTSGWTEEELLDEAKDLVIGDLLEAFQTDIISRLVRGKVQEHLVRWEREGMQTAKAPVVKEEPEAQARPPSEPAIKSLSALSFSKRRSADASRPSQLKRKVPPAGRLPSETPSETPSGGRAASDRGSPPAARKSHAKPAPPVVSDQSSDDEAQPSARERSKKRQPKKKAAPKKAKVHLDYTSSEDDEPAKESKAALVAIKEEPLVAVDVVAQSPADIEPTDKMDLDEKPRLERSPSLHAEQPKPKAVKRRTAPKAAKAVDLASLDPFEVGVAQDEEDLFFLKLALERLQLGKELIPTPPPSDDEADPPKHATGSARTEGFYPITVEEKMANRPASNRAKANQNGAAANAAAASSVAVSRLARANTRGLVRGMELHKKVTATDTDVLKFNQLKTRKKQLTFARSGIEGYGLFALEHIPVGDMVIEYVGELIRQTVADRREKAYERSGIGSSYLFRVDEDLVVDATKKGNLGRLINHCCAPNCTARIITINGVKKIVIYAKSNIEPGEEVTYDYHFPIEEDNKIPCLCGAESCKTWLN